ncbi:MAG: ABC-F type ribosomal protection protein [Firmicutes bacterium]|nr:ABC-F type ribosomal protection protein [Bacillota bacterium]
MRTIIELALNKVKKFYGADLVLNDISFTVNQGEKVGIVGDNGSGKTTIFKGITDFEPIDDGTITFRKSAIVGYLDQIPQYPEHFTVKSVLQEAFQEIYQLQDSLTKLEHAMQSLTGQDLERAIKQYGALQQEFELQGGYELTEKFGRVITGLKISEDMLNQPFGTLSGGEKTKVVLGQILLRNPDILLLDEPSNHLDLESIEWLESYLRDYQGTVLIISHDRYFLDKVVTKIIEVEDGEATTFKGNYSRYFEEKERQLLLEFATYQDQQAKIKAMEEAIQRYKIWGTAKYHKKAASVQKRLDKIVRMERPVLEKQKMELKFAQTDRSGDLVVVSEKLSKHYGERVILSDIDFNLRFRERVAIVGKNGSGKSTFLKCILGLEKPTTGTVRIGARVDVGYLPQDCVFPNPQLTVLQWLRERFRMSEPEARSRLSRFLFFGEDVEKRINMLSGGERSRLKLCELMEEEPNLLILDEPTNHLDISSIEVLEDALLDFPGTILFVSHVRYFINKIAQKVIELENGDITEYLGNYDYYRQKKAELIVEIAPPIKERKPRKTDTAKRKETTLFKQLEEEILIIEEKIKGLDEQMIAAVNDYKKLVELSHQRDDYSKRLEELYEKWAEADPTAND